MGEPQDTFPRQDGTDMQPGRGHGAHGRGVVPRMLSAGPKFAPTRKKEFLPPKAKVLPADRERVELASLLLVQDHLLIEQES